MNHSRQLEALYVALVVIACLILSGCASNGIQTASGEQITNVIPVFERGDARLSCDTSCSGAWGSARRRAKTLYEQGLWTDLAVEVARVGFRADQTYFYLGRAAEGLGYPDAAQTYYKLGLVSPYKCAGTFNNCDGLIVPSELSAGLDRLLRRTLKSKNVATESFKSAEMTDGNQPSTQVSDRPLSAPTSAPPKATLAIDPLRVSNGIAASDTVVKPSSLSRERIDPAPSKKEPSSSDLSATLYTSQQLVSFIDRLRQTKEKKGEFESTAQFAARTSGIDGKPIIVEIALNGRGSAIHPVNYLYDADNQVFTTYLRGWPAERSDWNMNLAGSSSNTNFDTACVFEKDYPVENGTGQNAYGAQRNISIERSESWCLAFVNLESNVLSTKGKKRDGCIVAGSDFGGSLLTDLRVSANDIQTILPNLRYRLEGVLTKVGTQSTIGFGVTQIPAKLNNPKETNSSRHYLPMRLTRFQLVNVRSNDILVSREPCGG